jgi:hypothetical protein
MQSDTVHVGETTGVLWWIKVGLTLFGVAIGGAGLAYALDPALDRNGSRTVRTSPREIALLPLDEKSRLATRITVDRTQKSLCISREIVYGHDPAMVSSGDSLLIPDEAGLHQISVFDQTLQVDDMEVRVVLHRFGPTETYYDRPNSSTELILWVNGQARVAGFLEGSAYGDDGTPIWERLAIYRRGGVLVATAAIGEYPLIRRGVVNGNLSTDNPWILEASQAFPSAADIDRYLDEHDDEATPTSLPATSTIVRRKPLPS